MTILSATTNGLWLSHLINPKAFDRHEALQAIDEYLASTFPKHFPLESM